MNIVINSSRTVTLPSFIALFESAAFRGDEEREVLKSICQDVRNDVPISLFSMDSVRVAIAVVVSDDECTIHCLTAYEELAKDVIELIREDVEKLTGHVYYLNENLEVVGMTKLSNVGNRLHVTDPKKMYTYFGMCTFLGMNTKLIPIEPVTEVNVEKELLKVVKGLSNGEYKLVLSGEKLYHIYAAVSVVFAFAALSKKSVRAFLGTKRFDGTPYEAIFWYFLYKYYRSVFDYYNEINYSMVQVYNIEDTVLGGLKKT